MTICKMRCRTMGMLVLLTFAGVPVAFVEASELSGSVATTTTPINLTTEGSADWAYWQGTTLANHAQKASPIVTLGAMSQVGTYTISDFGGSTGITYNWSDGNAGNPGGAAGSGDGIVQAVQSLGTDIGEGFRITAPADQITRTISLYLGEFDIDGVLTATLSDGSEPVLILDDQAGTSGGTALNKTFTIDYAASAPDQMLTLDWTVDQFGTLSANSNIFIAGATLSPAVELQAVPEPASVLIWAALGVMCCAYVGYRKRRSR